MNRDDRIPFERVLMLCALGFLLGILFGCGRVPTDVACLRMHGDTTLVLTGAQAGMTATIATRGCL